MKFRAVWRRQGGMLILGCLVWAVPVAAQQAGDADPQALADIRIELQGLQADMAALRRELVVSDPSVTGVANPAPVLERIDLYEEELRRITGQVEALQNQVERIVADGTNRIGDLEFRLLELEGGDFATLEPTVPLGEGAPGPSAGTVGAGVGVGGGVPASTRPMPRDETAQTALDPGGALIGQPDPAGQITTELPQTSGLAGGESDPDIVVPPIPDPVIMPDTEVLGEQAAFDAALTLYREDKARQAADAFADFMADYPGGPLAVDAAFWRGEALSVLGDWNGAARSFLDSFSGAPSGPRAPEALLRLGESLGQLGQMEEACLTLAEVTRRYPDADAEVTRRTGRAQQSLACF